MVWMIIGVVLVAAFGPIFWVMPSRRDRQLARIREEARKLGLNVEVTQIPKLHAAPEELVSASGVARDATLNCSAYRLALHDKAEFAPSWFLLRDPASREPISGWAEHPKVRTLRMPKDIPKDIEDYWQRVKGIVGELADDCDGLEANSGTVSWYWRERLHGRGTDELVDDIHGRLLGLSQLQRSVDDAARLPSEP
ncbi:MAG: hypothetical protein O7H39_19770 [Gammaproteobacteria bacterium]|nr:hypothetical protein [Gammaproteobacteria bacterium]